jgi:hypothetical protein
MASSQLDQDVLQADAYNPASPSPDSPTPDMPDEPLLGHEVVLEAKGRVGPPHSLKARILPGNRIRIDCHDERNLDFWMEVTVIEKRKAEPAEQNPSKRSKFSRCDDCDCEDARACTLCGKQWCSVHFGGRIAVHHTGPELGVCCECVDKYAEDFAWEKACEKFGVPWP